MSSPDDSEEQEGNALEQLIAYPDLYENLTSAAQSSTTSDYSNLNIDLDQVFREWEAIQRGEMPVSDPSLGTSSPLGLGRTSTPLNLNDMSMQPMSPAATLSVTRSNTQRAYSVGRSDDMRAPAAHHGGTLKANDTSPLLCSDTFSTTAPPTDARTGPQQLGSSTSGTKRKLLDNTSRQQRLGRPFAVSLHTGDTSPAISAQAPAADMIDQSAAQDGDSDTSSDWSSFPAPTGSRGGREGIPNEQTRLEMDAWQKLLDLDHIPALHTGISYFLSNCKLQGLTPDQQVESFCQDQAQLSNNLTRFQQGKSGDAVLSSLPRTVHILAGADFDFFRWIFTIQSLLDLFITVSDNGESIRGSEMPKTLLNEACFVVMKTLLEEPQEENVSLSDWLKRGAQVLTFILSLGDGVMFYLWSIIDKAWIQRICRSDRNKAKEVEATMHLRDELRIHEVVKASGARELGASLRRHLLQPILKDNAVTHWTADDLVGHIDARFRALMHFLVGMKDMESDIEGSSDEELDEELDAEELEAVGGSSRES